MRLNFLTFSFLKMKPQQNCGTSSIHVMQVAKKSRVMPCDKSKRSDNTAKSNLAKSPDLNRELGLACLCAHAHAKDAKFFQVTHKFEEGRHQSPAHELSAYAEEQNPPWHAPTFECTIDGLLVDCNRLFGAASTNDAERHREALTACMNLHKRKCADELIQASEQSC